jgi:hypothetical protein
MGWAVRVTTRSSFTPGKESRYALDGRLGGPQTCLDTEVREQILCLCRGSNPGCPVCCQTLYWLIYRSSRVNLYTGAVSRMTTCGKTGVWFPVGALLRWHRPRSSQPADHPSPCTAEVKSVWSRAYTPHVFMPCCLHTGTTLPTHLPVTSYMGLRRTWSLGSVRRGLQLSSVTNVCIRGRQRCHYRGSHWLFVCLSRTARREIVTSLTVSETVLLKE